MRINLHNGERVPIPAITAINMATITSITVRSDPPNFLRFVSIFKDNKEVEVKIRITVHDNVQMFTMIPLNETQNYELGVDFNGSAGRADSVPVDISFNVC